MRVRDLGPDDLVPFQQLCSLAFGGSVSATGPAPFHPGQSPLGIDAPGGEGLAAALTVRHDRIAVGGGIAPCGGIGGVSVHPAHRGGGMFAHLMTAAIARSTQLGHAFSMLYPSNPGIYRALGYQKVSQVDRLVVPLADLRGIPAPVGLHLSPVTAASMPEVRALYREVVDAGNALLLREGPLFGEEMPAPPWTAVLVRDTEGTAQGYLSFARTPDGPAGTGLEVFDLLGRRREHVAALLRSLASWSTVTDAALVRTRQDDPLLDVIPGGRVRPDPGVLPLVMMRVIDTAAALQARPAPHGLHGSIRLQVTDATGPGPVAAAAGDFLVGASEGTVHVHRLADGAGTGAGAHEDPTPPDVRRDEDPGAGSPRARLDIHAASLLLAGGRSLAEARRLGLAADADPAAEAFLDTLLAGPRPSVLDFF